MAKYDDVRKIAASHVLLVGDPKAGKSTLAAELANYYNLYWISTDMGHEVIGKLPKEARDRVDLVMLPDTSDYPIAITTTKKLFKQGFGKICDRHGMIDCKTCTMKQGTFTNWDFRNLDPEKDIVVLDHLSGVGDSCMNLICKGKKNTGSKGYQVSIDDDDSNYQPELGDYGALKKFMAELMLSIQNAQYNVLCLAHATEATLEDKSKKLVPQVGSDATSRTIAKYFGHVVYCHVSSASHKFGSATTYMSSVITGSRTDVAIEQMAVPSLKAFFDGTVGVPASQLPKSNPVTLVAGSAVAPGGNSSSGLDLSKYMGGK